MRRAGTLLVTTIFALGLGATGAAAESSVVLPKAGQVGLSVGGGYATLLDSGNVGSVFGAGPEFNVRLRYRMRYERGLGLSFESQTLDAREEAGVYVPPDESTVMPTELSLILSGAEFYQMFGTRTKTTKMIMVGAGLAQMRADTNTGEVEFSGKYAGDGLFVSAGAGFERFVYRSWAWDLSSRYSAVFRDGQVNHDVRLALGVIFYASY